MDKAPNAPTLTTAVNCGSGDRRRRLVGRPITTPSGSGFLSITNRSLRGQSVGGYAALVLLIARAPSALGQADSAATARDSVRLRRPIVSTLTDLLDGQDASLGVYRATGLVGDGGILRLRGVRSTLLSNAPAVEIDGFIVPVESAPMFTNLSSLSFLDLLDPNDVATIEVVSDPARAALAGPGLANGLIRITTRRGESHGIRFRTISDVGVRDDATDYGLSSFGLGPVRAESCSYFNSASGRCTLSSVLVRNPARDPGTSILRTGRQLKQWLGLSGSTGRLTFSTSGHVGLSTGDFGLPGIERSYAEQLLQTQDLGGRLTDPSRLAEWSVRGTGALRVRSNLRVDLTGGAARQIVRLPYPQTDWDPFLYGLDSYLLAASHPSDSLPWDQVARPALLWETNPERRLHQATVHGQITWSLTARLSAWANGGLGWSGSTDVTEVTDPVPPILILPGVFLSSNEHDTTRYRDTNHSADAGIRWTAIDHGAIRLSATALLQYRRRSLDFDRVFRAVNSSSTSIASQGSTLGQYFAPTLEVGRRGTLTGYLRHDDVRPGIAGQPGLISFGGFGRWTVGPDGWAVTASAARIQRRLGIDEIPVGMFQVAAPPGVPNEPETLRHLEAGFEGHLGRTTSLRIDAYHQRTSHGVGNSLGVGPIGGVIPVVGNVEAEIRNQGVELRLSSRVLSTARTTLDLGLHGSLSSTKLEHSDGQPIAQFVGGFLPSGCSQVGAAPFSACEVPVTYHDLNGNGLIDPGEATPEQRLVAAGSKYPTRTAVGFGNLSLAAAGGWISIGLQADYAGGMRGENGGFDVQCIFHAQCQTAVEPQGTSLHDQALIATGFGVTERISYLRLRELSVAYRTTGSLARSVRARQMTVTLAGRNLWTLTGYRGWDPELQTIPGDGFAGAESPPPIRRTITVRVALGW